MKRKNFHQLNRDRRPSAAQVQDEHRRSQAATQHVLYAPPVGSMLEYAGSELPDDDKWLWSDGTILDQTDYPELFSIIGTNFNTGGEGAAQFRLPDRRGRTAIGAGTGTGLTPRSLGAQVGVETHALATSEMPPHNHDVFYDINTDADTGTTKTRHTIKSPNNGDTSQVTSTRGGNGLGAAAAHQNMQPSLALNFIIRALP